jgi:DNA-binding SARP family transcriptional activator/tetratricopeptide (TPR) repeat protein
MVRYGILGPVELYAGERRIPIGGRRQVALLACLLVNANRPVPPDLLIEAVWGGQPSGATVKSVQMAVARLRKVLARDGHETTRASVLRTVTSGYLLEVSPGECDADVARERIAEGREALGRGDARRAATALREALRLWRGPVLAELAYEDFAQAAINRLEELRLSALGLRIEAELQLGEHATVLPELEALVVEHPDDEQLARHLIVALYRCGRQGAALDAYHRTRAYCLDQGREPGPRFRQLQEDVLAHAPWLQSPGGAGAAPAEPPAPPGERRTDVPTGRDLRPIPGLAQQPTGAFIGRTDALEHLHAQWQRCLGGETGLVLVTGEAGVGKTRLVLHFGEEAQRHGGVVLYGRAEEDALRPFQPFADALDQLLDHAGPAFADDVAPALQSLSQLFADPASGTPPPAAEDREHRFHVFQALVAVLVRATRLSPVLLALDDLQWADKPTLLLLRHVVRQAKDARLLVIGAFRDVRSPSRQQVDNDRLQGDQLARWLAGMGVERRLDVLDVAGFDVDETRALVADRLGVPVTAELVRRLHDRTEGNAFFIEETVRAIEGSGLASAPVVDSDALEEVGVPATVRDAVVQRYRDLSPLAGDLLEAASVIGRSVDLETICRLFDATRTEVVAAAEENQATGLLVEVPGRGDVLSFSHDVVRDVFYEWLGAPRRLLLHYEVGRTLERLSREERVNPAELALHFKRASDLAGDPPPRRYADPARKYKIEAGWHAARLYAYEEAARHLVDALALSDPADAAGRCDVLLALGRVRSQAGATVDDTATARDAFLDAFACAERAGDPERLARAAYGVGERYFEMTYSDSNHLDLLEKALAALGPEGGRLRARLLSRLAENLGFPDEHERARELADQALALARELGDERLLFAVLLARHVTLLDVRHLDERLAIHAELASLTAGHELMADHHHWRMYDLLERGDLAAAREQHAQLEELAARLRQPLYRSIAAGARGLFAELDGKLTVAERCARESLRYAGNARTLDAMSAWAGQEFRRRVRRGRLGTLTRVVEQLAFAGGHKLGWRSALGLLRFDAGDTAGARRIYREELAGGPAALPRGMFWLTRVTGLSELCARLGEAADALALYEQLLPHRHRNVVVAYCSFWGPVEGVLGLLARTYGDDAAADAHMDLALQQAREMGATLLAQDLEARRSGLLERPPASGRA